MARSLDISKSQAVTQALNELGDWAKPVQIRDHIKKTLGIEISKTYIYNIKSGLNQSAPARAKAPATKGKPTGELSLKDIEATMDLTRKVGAKVLHSLIDLVAK